MQPIDILIVDDEQPARRKIQAFLKELASIGTIDEAQNGPEAVEKILNQKPHLVLLDIQMPGMNGFQVIETVGAENMPVVIFVTAYDQYALNAFEVQAVDYLLKPFDEERFRKAFQRAIRQIQYQITPATAYQNLLNGLQPEKKYWQRILVHEAGKYFFVPVNEILWFSAEEKYISLHTLKTRYLIRETMSHLEEMLEPQQFVRIHRSYIVNVEAIKEMQPWSHGDYIAILKNGEKLTISRRFRERLFGKI